MANRIANLLGNTKTRTLVLLVIGILVIGVVVAVSQTGSSSSKESAERVSKTTSVPNQVKSTPGEQVTPQYQELQEKANARGAEEAEKKGVTFIPTLTGNTTGFSDKDFDKQLSAAYDDLGGKCSKDTVDTLRKQGMDNNKAIMQLKCYGCSAAAIAALFTPDELAAALVATKGCGVSGAAVTGCSTDDAKTLQAQGMNATQIAATFKNNKCDFTQTAAALKAIGTSYSDIAAALKANGADYSEIAAALKANGADYSEIAAALKANGANIDDIASALKAAGASATEIAAALSKAGFSNLDILHALTKAGFSATDIAKAMSSLGAGGADNAALLAQQRANDAAAQRLAAQQEAQQLSAYSQQRAQKIQELVAAMDAQKTAAMQTWNDVPQQVLIQGEWATKKKDGSDENSSSSSKSKFSSSETDTGTGKVILKAGSILFATLDTAVDSDQEGPVMATIVSGEFKGSKVLGKMRTDLSSDTIALSFTAINMPKEPKSMGISAVAIDPDTARTALASDVDHHYLMRWGSLFASSFVQGYASAVASAGQTSTTSQGAAGTTTNTTSPGLNSKQQLFQGLSAVGSKWSEVVAKNFDTPDTITIDQGTGIGLLFTADFVYGADPTFYKGPSGSATGLQAAAVADAIAGTGTVSPGGLATGAPVSSTSTVGTSLSSDQAAALVSAMSKQQAGSTTTQGPVGAPGSTTTSTTTSSFGGT